MPSSPLPDAPGASDPAAGDLSDQAYFQAIEETFIRLRGAPLLLSPKDWQAAQRWHRAGVPLDLVLTTIEELLAQREERGDDRHVSSLRYFDRAIKGAWTHARELTAPGERASAPAAGLDLPARLEALAGALPDDLPGQGAFAARIRALAVPGGGGEAAAVPGVEAIETALAAIQDDATRALLAALPPDELATLEAAIDGSLGPLSGRLPQEEIDRTRTRLLHQRLRRRHHLPTLSLFGPLPE